MIHEYFNTDTVTRFTEPTREEVVDDILRRVARNQERDPLLLRFNYYEDFIDVPTFDNDDTKRFSVDALSSAITRKELCGKISSIISLNREFTRLKIIYHDGAVKYVTYTVFDGSKQFIDERIVNNGAKYHFVCNGDLTRCSNYKRGRCVREGKCYSYGKTLVVE